MTDSDESNSHPPGLLRQARRLAVSGLAALHNRGELFAVELQEEKARLVELLVWTVVAGFLGMIFVILATATIIFLFPAGARIYVAVGFCVFYLVAAVLALLNLRALWKDSPVPFSDTIAEGKKDVEWLESLK